MGIKRGAIVEVEVVVQPTGLNKVAELFSTLEQLLPSAQAAGLDTEMDADTEKTMRFVGQLGAAGEADSLSIVARVVSTPEYQFGATLRGSALQVLPDGIEGEATLFAKIQRKLRSGETYMMGALFAGLEQMLDHAAQKELATVFEDPAIQALGLASPLLAYPAAMLTPIAIYR